MLRPPLSWIESCLRTSTLRRFVPLLMFFSFPRSVFCLSLTRLLPFPYLFIRSLCIFISLYTLPLAGVREF